MLSGLVALIFFPAAIHAAGPLHLDLEMSGAEYRAILERIDVSSLSVELRPVLELGKRNLDWLQHINAHRAPTATLSFSSAATQIGISITDPRANSPSIVFAKVDELKKTLPLSMRAVLFENGAFTDNPGISDADYIQWGRSVDMVYQSASRWVLQEPFLTYYALRKRDDIRGYYFLSRTENLERVLESWPQLSESRRSELREWLIGLCLNDSAQVEAHCREQFVQSAATPGEMYRYYLRYLPTGQSKFDSYFRIASGRQDVRWTATVPQVLFFPFQDLAEASVKSFLRDNIEDEWQFSDWKLKLDFTSGKDDLTHIVFVPGATPHVNALGGSEITMDANQPLTEYNVQWTIRHEFGHVLGLPDCYVEFFDEARGEMINYQIDVTNLMCSRRGHIQQIHYDELKRVYFR